MCLIFRNPQVWDYWLTASRSVEDHASFRGPDTILSSFGIDVVDPQGWIFGELEIVSSSSIDESVSPALSPDWVLPPSELDIPIEPTQRSLAKPRTMSDHQRFRGTTAVVTGGAAGIGLACAHEFAALGCDILLADLDPAKLDEARQSLLARGIRAETIICDVTKDADARALLEKAKAMGRVSILMLNAGVSAGGRLELIPVEEWKRLFEVNVFGVVRGLNAFIPVLDRGSHVIVTGSNASLFATPDGMDGPYSSSKHAVLGLVKAFRNYLAPRGVSVQMLAPRLTDTAFPRSSVGWGAKGPRVWKDRVVPKDEADTPEDVARIMVSQLGEKLVVCAEGDASKKLKRFAEEDVIGIDPKL